MAAAARLACVIVTMLGSASLAYAQMPVPEAAKPSGEELFKRQCATCHAVQADAPPRQGPNLAGIVGRKAGSLPGFKYSAGFAKADWTWDDEKLNAWLKDPQAMIPGAIMPYKQPKADVRAAIVSYLDEVH